MIKAVLISACVAAIAFLGAFVILSARTLLEPIPVNQPQATTSNAAAANEHQAANIKGEKPSIETLWRRTRSDPVAFFTFWLAVLSLILTIVALIQIILLINADSTSNKAANAANKSAVIAEQALIAGNRAFVAVVHNSAAGVDSTTGKITQYIFTPTWINSGNTPTRNMKNHISVQVFNGKVPDNFDFPDRWKEGTDLTKTSGVPLGVGPKGTVNGQAVAIPIADMIDIANGKKVALYWGWATYNDVFPNTERHVTRFAVMISVGGNPEVPAHTSISFPFIGKYNCSDEECDAQGLPAGWKPRDEVAPPAKKPRRAPRKNT